MKTVDPHKPLVDEEHGHASKKRPHKKNCPQPARAGDVVTVSRQECQECDPCKTRKAAYQQIIGSRGCLGSTGLDSGAVMPGSSFMIVPRIEEAANSQGKNF